MTPEIFVSYARSDQEHVFPIVEKLREKGLNIWIDQEGIHGAKLWSQEIVHAIEGCKVFILFASSTAFQSENVTKELALASEARKKILPVFLEDAPIPAAMKYQLAGIQHLIHEKGQTPQTIDNVLRTLSNLELDLVEAPSPAPTVTHAPQRTQSAASKKPLAIGAVAVVTLLAVLAFFLAKGGAGPGSSEPPATAKVYKSTTDLCIVTVHNSGGGSEVSEENRELREELDAKLIRFKDYKVAKGKAVSPDATTQELIAVAKELDAEFILQATINSDKNRINAKLLNVEDGRNFWTKTLRESDIEGEGNFIDESTGLIAAHIAGHDGAIHRDILAKALVKKEEDLTPMELLQLGKAVWEEQTEGVTASGTRYLEKCIELNPDISTAHAILSEIYLEDIRRDYNRIPDAMAKAKAAVARAIELNPSNAIALIEQIWISWFEKDFTNCKVQIEAAMRANPYEPLVLVSAGSFLASTGQDLEAGKEYIDQALRYNETPQIWYYYGYLNYYLTKNEPGKALEYSLKQGIKNEHHLARAVCLYWINGDFDTAKLYYNQLVERFPTYSLDSIRRDQEVWSAGKVSRDLLQAAFKEIVDAAGENAGASGSKKNKKTEIGRSFKSTTDLCLVTVYESETTKEVSEGNRELREELNAKLTLFKDYKVESAQSISPDATTQELIAVAKELDTEFILQATINKDKNRINAKLLNVEDSQNFWSKTLRESDVQGDGEFIDEATVLIAAHIAGHDGAIHRDILKKALVKKEEDLTPMELLQMGKALWEDATSENTIKAIEYLNRCIELNPDISTAYGILSEVYLEDLRGGYGDTPDALAKAKEAARRAVELEPSNAIAIIEQIWISWYEKDVVAVKLQIEQAMKANPYEPLVLASAGTFNGMTGVDYEAGFKQINEALRLNDTPQRWYYSGLATYYISKMEYAKALENSHKITNHTELGLPMVAALYWVTGEEQSALRYYGELMTREPNFERINFEHQLGIWMLDKPVRDLLYENFSKVEEAAKASQK